MADAPAAPATPAPSGGGVKGKVEDPKMVLILGLVTCNLYTMYWLWNKAKEMNAYLGEERVNPLFIIPGCLCFPAVIYGSYLFAKGLPDMQKKAGVEAKDEFVLHLVLMIFLPWLAAFMIQQKLNELWAK
jgi:hypothetical protein